MFSRKERGRTQTSRPSSSPSYTQRGRQQDQGQTEDSPSGGRSTRFRERHQNQDGEKIGQSYQGKSSALYIRLVSSYKIASENDAYSLCATHSLLFEFE